MNGSSPERRRLIPDRPLVATDTPQLVGLQLRHQHFRDRIELLVYTFGLELRVISSQLPRNLQTFANLCQLCSATRIMTSHQESNDG